MNAPASTRAQSDFVPAFSAENLTAIFLEMSKKSLVGDNRLNEAERQLYRKLVSVVEGQVDLMLAARDRMATPKSPGS